jgi:hypothetical protein
MVYGSSVLLRVKEYRNHNHIHGIIVLCLLVFLSPDWPKDFRRLSLDFSAVE